MNAFGRYDGIAGSSMLVRACLPISPRIPPLAANTSDAWGDWGRLQTGPVYGWAGGVAPRAWACTDVALARATARTRAGVGLNMPETRLEAGESTGNVTGQGCIYKDERDGE